VNTLVYIAGFGFSGSTMLDMLLGSDPHVVGLGEAMYLPDYAANGKRCTCGKVLAECPLWGRVLPPADAVEARFFAVRYHHDTFYRAVAAAGYRLNGEERAWAEYQFTMLRAVGAATGKSVFVDSSKNLARLRLYEMVRPNDFELRVLHLVRDPHGVMESGKKHMRPIRAAAGWLHTNYVIAAYLRGGKVASFPLTYRALALETLGTLNRVHAFCGLPAISALPVPTVEGKHNIEGSPSRFRFTQIYYDDDWKRVLRPLEKAVGWTLAPAYGFFTRPARPSA
jgi:hypothetical protein